MRLFAAEFKLVLFGGDAYAGLYCRVQLGAPYCSAHRAARRAVQLGAPKCWVILARLLALAADGAIWAWADGEFLLLVREGEAEHVRWAMALRL